MKLRLTEWLAILVLVLAVLGALGWAAHALTGLGWGWWWFAMTVLYALGNTLEGYRDERRARR